MEAKASRVLFNRAFYGAFDARKNVLISLVLFWGGLLLVFFRALSFGASPWVRLNLIFMPIFLCSGLLLALGVVLVRMYRQEQKQKKWFFQELIVKYGEVILGASYFAVPVALLFLLLWFVVGVFILFSKIPVVGPLFGAFLASVPFLLNSLAISLLIATIAFLFFASPLLAVKQGNFVSILRRIFERFWTDPYQSLSFFFRALFPVLGSGLVLWLSSSMTKGLFPAPNEFVSVLRMFFMMIPFVLLISPAICFFFNYACEANSELEKLV